MSGPVSAADATVERAAAHPQECEVEVTDSRLSQVGDLTVRRALPRRGRRTIGAWCFADHMGPASVTETHGIDIGPHPHIGLQTVTWLLAGEVLHRDSLGSEQVIRPGELNLMTAGHGVSHSEEATSSYRGELQGVQLWVAQPAATRDGEAAFEHHADLPRTDVDRSTATVLIGEFAGATSPARRDTDHVGVDLELRPGETTVPLIASNEYAFVVLEGAVSIGGGSRGGTVVGPGHLAYLGVQRDEVRMRVDVRTRALLIGGVPFPEPVLMWWNFVARDRAEITAAHDQWTAADERFGRVDSPLPRILTGPPPWADQQH